MNPEAYAAQQAVISAAIANYTLTFGRFFVRQALPIADWLNLLGLLFPEVKRQREEAAALARRFYDYQRQLNHPNLPRNDRLLEGTDFRTFVQNMEPTRRRMSQEDSPQHALTSLALRTVREVENAGRQQLIHAVRDDPAKDIIRGWARVATGRETCAWCLMLISRGPVYMGADTAGLDLDDESAARMIAAGEDVTEFMEQWHDGCDCKVVPVFKNKGWFGQDAADRALDLWDDATETAKLLRKLDPDRVHLAGKSKGKPFTLNEDVINVLRGRLSSGDIDMNEFSALAA